jgi:hypothetical protein
VRRGLWLLGLALCGIADAIAQPRLDLAVTPAWSGWSRPGRATEVDVRLTSSAATQATLEIVAGRQTVRAQVGPAEALTVSATLPLAASERRDVVIAQSESPLLGVGLATSDAVRLEGFHTVALGADDLPRNASAYASIDALVLDAPTLGALDQRQLGALLAHAGECGRVVLLNPDPRVRRMLAGAGACGGRALMSATSLGQAREMLESSFGAGMAPAISLAGIGDLARPGHVNWNRVLVALTAYFAAAALAFMFFSFWPVLLLLPALATLAILALLHALQPSPQLVVWSEGESGAQVARYQAWQGFPGLVRGRARVPVLPQLASARSCSSSQPILFDFDPSRARVTFAEFDTRLFRQNSLCYSGSFPVVRTIAVEARPDGLLDVRNAGTMAWPKGVLLADRLAHDLPAVGPGESTVVHTQGGAPLRDAVARTAWARTRADGRAALWELELGRVANVPIDSTGWLLVSIPPP